MTLREIKRLHESKGLPSKDLRLDQDTMIKTLNLLERVL